ncbi:MAG: transcriptional regulator [Clostridiaceae bacterium]|jgi:DeoR/GlpR family transcriptional regulator of sugar metabolism|nr:transcriptional regulator [Clostridiaceae bacterium]
MIILFAQERQIEIIKILNKEGKLIVKDLSSKFNVTEDCIRKDLKILESESLLQRTYGGAVPMRKSAHNDKIESRKSFNVKSKDIIAEKAFNVIEDGETIFLDISTTNIILAQKLGKSHKKVTVITNMIDIISVLNNEINNIKVICPGGVLSKDLNGFTGSMAIENIANYKLNRAFIGSCGVNLTDKSVTTFDVEDGNTKKAIIKNSQIVYLVMESNKFYFDGTYKFATLHDINTIIIENNVNKDILNILSKTNTEIL